MAGEKRPYSTSNSNRIPPPLFSPRAAIATPNRSDGSSPNSTLSASTPSTGRSDRFANTDSTQPSSATRRIAPLPLNKGKPSTEYPTSSIATPSEDGLSRSTLAIRYVGLAAQERINYHHNTFRGTPHNPHLSELAKLASYPNNKQKPDFKKADAEADELFRKQAKHHHSSTPSTPALPQERQERILSLWIPHDPNDDEAIPNSLNIRTLHNKSVAAIERVVGDVIEDVTAVFRIMTSCADRFSVASNSTWEDLAHERQDQIITALRLKGIQVHLPFYEEWDDVEVEFERPEVRAGRLVEADFRDLGDGLRAGLLYPGLTHDEMVRNVATGLWGSFNASTAN